MVDKISTMPDIVGFSTLLTIASYNFIVLINSRFWVFISDGGIAQLGERLNGIQEVSGSIPLISTNTINHEAKTSWFYHTQPDPRDRTLEYSTPIRPESMNE